MILSSQLHAIHGQAHPPSITTIKETLRDEMNELSCFSDLSTV